MNHPGFKRDLERLVRTAPGERSAAELASVADAWGISLWDLQVLLAELDLDEPEVRLGGSGMEFEPGAAEVFVEVRRAAYVLWVPKLVARRHRRAISGWLDDVRGEPWLTQRERERGTKRPRRPRPTKDGWGTTLGDRLDWFVRWNGGESFRAIWDREWSRFGVSERDVMNAVNEIRRRMAALSPEGLRELDRPR